MAKGQDLGPVVVSFSADASKYLRVSEKIVQKAVKVRQRLEGEAQKQANEIVRQAQKASDEVVKKMDQTSRKIAASMNRIGRSITMAFSVPISAGLAQSVRSFARLDRAIVNTGAIFGNVSTRMRNQLAAFTQELATKTIFSAGDLAEAFIRVARTGVDAEVGMKILGETALFAQASMLELADASTILFDALAALGKKDIKNSADMLKDLSRLADLLTFAANKSQATSEELAISLSRKAGAAFRVANISMEEGIALLQVYAEQGIKGALAGERTEIFLRELARAQKKSSELWRKLGLELTDAQGRLLPLADILKQLEDQFERLGPVQLRTNLETLGFQQRAIAATLNLIGLCDKLRQFTEMNRQAGRVVKDLADNQMMSFANSMKVLLNEIDNASQAVGKQLAPVLQGLAKIVSVIAEAFQALPEGMQRIIAIFGGLSIIVGPAIIGFGQLIFFGKEVIKLIEASADAAEKRRKASDTLIEGYNNEVQALARLNAELGKLQQNQKTNLAAKRAPIDLGEQFGPPKPEPPKQVTTLFSKTMRDKRGRILSAEIQRMIREGGMLDLPEEVLRNLPDIPGQKQLFAELPQGGFRRRFPEKKIPDRPKDIVPKRASQNIDDVTRAMEILQRASEQAEPELNAVEAAMRRIQSAGKDASAGASEFEQAMNRIQKAAESAKKSAEKSTGLIIVESKRKKESTQLSEIEKANKRIENAAKNATPKLTELEEANQRIENAAKNAKPKLDDLGKAIDSIQKAGGGASKVVNDVEAATNRLEAAARNATPQLTELEKANRRIEEATYGPKKKDSNIRDSEDAITRIQKASEGAAPKLTELEEANQRLANAAQKSSDVITEGGLILKRNASNVEAAKKAQDAYRQSIGQTEVKLKSLFETMERAAPEMMQQAREVENLMRLALNPDATTTPPGQQMTFDFKGAMGDNDAEARLEMLRREARALAEIRERELPLLIKMIKKLGSAFATTGRGIMSSIKMVQSGVKKTGVALKNIGAFTAKKGMDALRKSVSLASAGMNRFAVAVSSPKEALKFFVGGPLVLAIKGLTTLGSVAKRTGDALGGPLSNGARVASASLMDLGQNAIARIRASFMSAVASSRVLSIAFKGLKVAVMSLKAAVAALVGGFLLFTVIDFAIGKLKDLYDFITGKTAAEEARKNGEKMADAHRERTRRMLEDLRKIKDENKRQIETEKKLKDAIGTRIHFRKRMGSILAKQARIQNRLGKFTGTPEGGVPGFVQGVADAAIALTGIGAVPVAIKMKLLRDLEVLEGQLEGIKKQFEASDEEVKALEKDLAALKTKLKQLDQAALEKITELTRQAARDIELMNPSLTTVEKGFLKFKNELEDMEHILARVPEKVRIDFEIKGVQRIIAELLSRIEAAKMAAEKTKEISRTAFINAVGKGIPFSEAKRNARLEADRDSKIRELDAAEQKLRESMLVIDTKAAQEGRALTKEELRQFKALRDEIDKVREAKKAVNAEFSAKKLAAGYDLLGKIVDSTREANNQVERFKFPQGTKRDAFILSQQIAEYKRQLIDAGVPMAMIQDRLARFEQSQRKLMRAKAFDKLRQEAEQLNESLKSPEKKFEDQFKRLKQMKLAGLISDQVFGKQLKVLKEQFKKDKEAEEKDKGELQLRKAGAFEAGTVEAASAISKAITERQNLQNQQLKAMQKQNALTQQTNQIMTKVNNTLKNKPVPSVAAGVP